MSRRTTILMGIPSLTAPGICLSQSREYMLISANSLNKSPTSSPAFEAGDPYDTSDTLAKGVR